MKSLFEYYEIYEIYEREFSKEKRKELADKGLALPDGSFPIENREDLKNAIKLKGLGKDPERAKAFIIKRAKALGAEDMIKDSWKVNEFGPLAGSGNKDELEDVKRKAMKQSERNKTVYVVMDKRGRYKTSNYYEEDNTFAGYHNGIAIDIDESLNECKKYAKPPKKR